MELLTPFHCRFKCNSAYSFDFVLGIGHYIGCNKLAVNRFGLFLAKINSARKLTNDKQVNSVLYYLLL